MSIFRIRLGPTSIRSTSANQWAPTLTSHDPNPPIPLESPAAVGAFEDDSWQSGFARIPVVLAAAALSVSVAISAGIHRANDDIVPVVAAEPASGESTGSFARRTQYASAQWRWGAPDERPTPVTAALDEGHWQPPAPAQPAVPTLRQYHQDDLTRPVVEEHDWRPALIFPPAFSSEVFRQQDEITRPVVEEQDWTSPYFVKTSYVLPTWWATDEIAVEVAAEAPAESTGSYPRRAQSASQQWRWDAPDELPSVAAAFVPDEDYWQQGRGFQPTPLALPAIEQGEYALATVFEDDSWTRPFSVPVPIQVSGPVWDDPVPVSPVDVDEDYHWRAYSIPATAYAITLWQQDEIPAADPPIIEEVYDWQPQRDKSVVVNVVFRDNEDYVARFVNPENDEWQTYTRIVSPPIVCTWFDQDELPSTVVVTAFDDDAWLPAAPRIAQPVIGAWLVQDEFPRVTVFEDDAWRITQPVVSGIAQQPIQDSGDFVGVTQQIEESEWRPPVLADPTPRFAKVWINDDPPFRAAFADDAWQVYTPLPPPLRFIWLPDPEVIPAGSLSPAVFGWGARSIIGSSQARDPWQRIGTEMAKQPPAIVGTESAADPWQRIGTETAEDVLKRIGTESATAIPGKIGDDDTQ